jgi:hypothetical protein
MCLFEFIRVERGGSEKFTKHFKAGNYALKKYALFLEGNTTIFFRRYLLLRKVRLFGCVEFRVFCSCRILTFERK